MKKKSLLYLLLFSVAFVACKKEDPKNDASSVRGKWNVDSIQTISYQNNNATLTSVAISSPNSFDFYSDSKVTYQKQSQSATSDYFLIDDNTVRLDLDFDADLDTAKIVTITANQSLNLRWTLEKYTYNGSNYETVKIFHLKK